MVAMAVLPRIEDLTRLRALYGRRGPRDGRTGTTPDGVSSAPWVYRVSAVVADAQRVLEMDDPTPARWREGMGLTEPVTQWSDECPSRGVGLRHARTMYARPGICEHCHAKIG